MKPTTITVIYKHYSLDMVDTDKFLLQLHMEIFSMASICAHADNCAKG